eukprot:COSAG01_NODE_18924_length_1043_cov_1.491525_2_plen_85_part_00
MNGLSNSWMVVPIVSNRGLEPMLKLSPDNTRTDNVLLEWMAALELMSRGHIQAVLPMCVHRSQSLPVVYTYIQHATHRCSVAVS